MGRMGPNISSRITFISSVTLSTTVGTIVRGCVMPPGWARLATSITRAPLVARILEQTREPGVVMVVDDRRVVGIRSNVRIELCDSLLIGIHESIHFLLSYKDIVGRYARLPAIGKLAVGNAQSSRAKPRAAFDDRGRFST